MLKAYRTDPLDPTNFPVFRMSKATRILPLIVLPLFTLILGWQLGMRYVQKEVADLQTRLDSLYVSATESGALVTDPEKEVNIGLLWGVWNLMLDKYIDTPSLNAQQMVYGAVRGMVASAGDPYTTFMTPDENVDFKDSLSGNLQGIGAELTVSNENILIVGIVKGSPAERAGLLPKDSIVSVDGWEAFGQPLNTVVSRIRGEKGTKVALEVYRDGDQALRSVTITREEIHVPSTEYEVKTASGGNVGLLSVHQFGSETVSEVEQILRGIDPKSIKGLVIDLRYNGGGYLNGAVDIASMFLRNGDVVSVVRRDEPVDVQKVSGNAILPDVPLVVLINEGSASASEILAGALQDNERATIIGMKSFGKGTVQEVVDLPGGSSLRVTIAKWHTPKGKDLSKEGVTPDVTVQQQEGAPVDSDRQLEAALQFLTTGKITVPTGSGATRN